MQLRDILKDIPRLFRKKGYQIVAGVFIRAVLDFIGVAALLSTILLLLADDKFQKDVWIIASVGVVFLIIKNILVIRMERSQTKYLLCLYQYYSSALLETYYKRGLLSIRGAGVAALTHEVNQVCYSFVLNVLSPILRIAGESLLLLMIVGALLIYSPMVVVLLVSLFIPLSLCYMYIIRKRIVHYGKIENSAKRRQWQIVEDTFRGYAEIEINQAYGTLYNRFKKELKQIGHNRVQSETLRRIPRALIEVAMAAALLLLILFFSNTEKLEVILGVFAVAAFRILPGLTSLINAWTQVKNAYYTVDVISAIKDRVTEDVSVDSPILFANELRVENVFFTYTDDGVAVIKDLSFSIKRGEFVGIQGMSGSGKSTVLNLLQGFFYPQEGRILIDDEPLCRDNCRAWQQIIGYVPQEVFIMGGTIAENVALGHGSKQIDYYKVRMALESVQLDGWVDSLPKGVDYLLTAYGNNVSGGQRQRIGIARALYKGAKILFFDEATSALDNYVEKEIFAEIKDLLSENPDLTLIMIAHRDSSLAICDRIINIENDSGLCCV